MITFVGLSSTVYPYMSSQLGCLSDWKFALATLVGFPATLYLHMIFKICCLRCYKIALVTLVGFSSLFVFIWFLRFAVWNVENYTGHTCWISSTMYLYMIFKIHCLSRWKIALITLVGFSPLFIFIWFLRLAVWDVVKLHWSHLLDFLHCVSLYDF